MSNQTEHAENAQTHIPQSVINAAIDLFEQLKGFARTPEQLTRAERQLGDIRSLLESATLQAPDTLHGLHELRKVVQREGETDIDAFTALLDLLPYLTGAHGVYTLEFHYEGRAQKDVRKTLEGWEVRNEGGEVVSLDEVFVMLRRRDLSAPVPAAAPA